MKRERLQPMLEINRPSDRYEREADRVADEVVRMGGVPGRASAPARGGVSVQRTTRDGAAPSASSASGSPSIVAETLRRPGRPLAPSIRATMETRFGHDFSQVRIHSDRGSAESARAVQARAYTVGHDIVFGSGEYDPGGRGGARLLAHELTHVVQQTGDEGSRASARTDPILQRQGTTGGGTAAACSIPSHCPSDFCSPLASVSDAQDDRDWWWPLLRTGIAAAVDSRVVPLWDQHVWGGASPQDLSGTFGADFTASETTRLTNLDIRSALILKLRRSPPTFPALGNTINVSVASLIPREIARLGDPSDSLRMDFNKIGEVPGNLAGDIGKDQATCKVGATPSPFADDRTLKGRLVIVFDPATNELTVTPRLKYVVKDTIDLCPGNCGAFTEQFATVSLSQWEATGISGDVPFTVEYDAGMSPFTLPLPGPPPRAAPPPAPPPTSPSVEVCEAKPGALVVRATRTPGKDRRIKLPAGTSVEVLKRTPATLADGTKTVWLRVKMLGGPEPGGVGLVQEKFVENCRMTP